jgi:hypothetical protein
MPKQIFIELFGEDFYDFLDGKKVKVYKLVQSNSREFCEKLNISTGDTFEIGKGKVDGIVLDIRYGNSSCCDDEQEFIITVQRS